jgi:hypothetical protein
LRNYRSDPDAYDSSGQYLLEGGGPCNGSNPNDGNKLDIDSNGDGVPDKSSGYPCKDQMGRTGGKNALGFQTLSPVFAWDNDFQGQTPAQDHLGGNLIVADHTTGAHTNTVTSTYHILAGRDFFNDAVTADAARRSYHATYRDDDGTTKAWTYRPYPYPHPLVEAGGP